MAASVLGSLLGFVQQVVPSSASDQRLWIKSLRKNIILPNKLQSVADEETAALLSDSCLIRIRNHVLRDALHRCKVVMEVSCYGCPSLSWLWAIFGVE
ncbi:hypothetical protein FD755_017120 [Muntiacus reevesi]|uniref:Uncharacterized protein n=1 Tax=Muntiacus reevesi TaxID=9886 RepID=A0A5N3X936_MUNRE|nr:hypothetical protein FD755_017120 [Muntiacus reevesi]